VSNAAILALLVVWLSLVGGALALLVLRSPKRRKPVDELEAADAALRNRLVDLEDKFEHYVKREAVRTMRGKKDADDAQTVLPLGRADRLRAAQQRHAAAGLTKGVRHGIAG